MEDSPHCPLTEKYGQLGLKMVESGVHLKVQVVEFHYGPDERCGRKNFDQGNGGMGERQGTIGKEQVLEKYTGSQLWTREI